MQFVKAELPLEMKFDDGDGISRRLIGHVHGWRGLIHLLVLQIVRSYLLTFNRKLAAATRVSFRSAIRAAGTALRIVVSCSHSGRASRQQNEQRQRKQSRSHVQALESAAATHVAPFRFPYRASALAAG
jgi:hypothetical protein